MKRRDYALNFIFLKNNHIKSHSSSTNILNSKEILPTAEVKCDRIKDLIILFMYQK